MTRKSAKPGSISRRRLLATVSAGAAFAASPFRINLLQAEETNIKIGFPVPLTGPYGTEAQDQVRAAQLAIAQFNDAGGLNGRKAELVVRDDKLNPGEAATRTLELVEREKVNFVVGSLSAAVQLAINNVTKERGIIFNSISQSDAINEAADFSRFTFHEALNPHMTSGAVGRYAFSKFGKKVAFLTADYA
jgi:branched-chain amino acid transport system substrate-binding protein